MSSTLPILEILPELKRALAASNCTVLQAPPGAGKTTAVPLALLAESWLAGGRILMLEPRRLAAAHAARFMAGKLGEEAGGTVGYTIRFERRTSAATRIEVVTEGVLTRRLQTDPELAGVGLVILDEFHERNLHSDLALALCRDVQLGLRPELRLLVMSATLEAAPVARLLGDCPVVSSAGRAHPVTVRQLPLPLLRLAEATAAGVRRALAETDGDILAFLPGSGEIRRCAGLLADLAGVDVRPLYGALPFAEQRRAIEPGPRRRLVLATNIAETSLTIEGVTTVVDSGFERRPRFDAGSGLSHLELRRISAASATQRAGRAGRLGPGYCYRLWSEAEQAELLPQAPPEIRTADLAPLALELACWGAQAEDLTWLDPPPPAALAQARGLLQLLGALAADGRPTMTGQRMNRLAAHPRIARMLLAAADDGQGPLGCELAALLEERDLLPRREHPPASDCDLRDRWEAFDRWRRQLPGPADAGAAAAVQRAADDLKRSLGVRGAGDFAAPAPERVGLWLAQGWPDRLGRRREPGSNRYQLAMGAGAALSRFSGLQRPELLVALQLEGAAGEGSILLASSVSAELVRRELADRIRRQRRVEWDERQQRVAALEEERLGELVLSARTVAVSAGERAAAAAAGVRRLGLAVLGWSKEAEQWLARARRLAAAFPEEGWPGLSAEHLLATVEQWLGPWLGGVSCRADLERLDPLPALEALLDRGQRQALERRTPTHLPVPSGSRIRIDYAAEGPPVLAAKLQELFGLAQTPALAEGRLPLVIHLLSPAGRPLAVTADLRSFWDSVYPQVRKEMRGRYPRHPWPDDPWTAPATRRVKPRA